MRPRRLATLVAALAALLTAGIVYASHHTVAILAPRGSIAGQERNLILFASALSLIVIIPVFALTIGIAWRYRADNHRAAYRPEWAGSRVAETIWWLIPSALIGILAVVAWQSSHNLDPFKPIAAESSTLQVQVVALQWKWLFIYPQQHVASLNYLEIPVGQSVHFDITSDAPMNSFWIPQLGGQVYAMPGMSTSLYLRADQAGNYRGESANISGAHFADMHFETKAVSGNDFKSWVAGAQHSPSTLDQQMYARLAKPAIARPTTYRQPATGLFHSIVEKYMSAQPEAAS